jgi:hypothetical protein
MWEVKRVNLSDPKLSHELEKKVGFVRRLEPARHHQAILRQTRD